MPSKRKVKKYYFNGTEFVFIQEYDSLKDASVENKVEMSNLSRRCEKSVVIKKPVGYEGFFWSYTYE